MIVLERLTKVYRSRHVVNTVFRDLNAVFPSRTSVAILGRNGAGKSTLLRVMSGAILPNSGRVLSDGNISFPIGLANSMHPQMTGAQNARFIARIYGADTDKVRAFVEDFAELGERFYLPVRTYSSGMQARLSFGINMALNFDTYLIDEVSAVGDANFKEKSEALFKLRMRDAGAIFISHSMPLVRRMCTMGAVLEGGRLDFYDDLEQAIWVHENNVGAKHSNPAIATKPAAPLTPPKPAQAQAQATPATPAKPAAAKPTAAPKPAGPAGSQPEKAPAPAPAKQATPVQAAKPAPAKPAAAPSQTPAKPVPPQATGAGKLPPAKPADPAPSPKTPAAAPSAAGAQPAKTDRAPAPSRAATPDPNAAVSAPRPVDGPDPAPTGDTAAAAPARGPVWPASAAGPRKTTPAPDDKG
ncbi:ATP-binding cassette domain-containing protein [Paracoccus jiaweipingae]|uniref:ATP-binding cassette domain-containing protein n=1 Tax=Paracoccus sp. p2-l61 TaxID=3366950 RepID=UPI0037B661FD